MADFVLQNYEKHDDYKIIADECLLYANFLNQPLTLGMFVPCLPSGEPFDKFQLEILNSKDLVPELRAAYKTAQSKVIFNGFDLIDSGVYGYDLFYKEKLVEVFTEYNQYNSNKKMEDLIQYNLDLAVSF
jgi:hypothetical protein